MLTVFLILAVAALVMTLIHAAVGSPGMTDSKTEDRVTLVELIWLDEAGEVIHTSSGTDEMDASDAMMRFMRRHDRPIKHGDHFETAEYE